MTTLWGVPYQPRNIEKYDIVVMGVPYDFGAGMAAASRWAPSDIREVSKKHLHLPKGKADLHIGTERFMYDISICDIGDAHIGNSLNPIVPVLDKFNEWKSVPLVLGGDHSITPYVVRATKPDVLILFDAHADDSEACEARGSHAAVTSSIPEKIDVWRYGLRHPHAKPYDTSVKLFDHPPRIYVSVDIDVFDIPNGTGYPVPGGMSFKEFINTLMGVTTTLGGKIVGMDIMEVADNQYTSKPVSNLASYVAMHLCNAVSYCKRGQPWHTQF